MIGTIINYRLGRHHQKPNHLVVKAEGVSNKDEAKKLIGKSVTWNTGKKDMVGKITSIHGNSGCVRAVFDTGIPGQAMGTKVKIQ
jgi:large subunit ribosomal protein L35Ae